MFCWICVDDFGDRYCIRILINCWNFGVREYYFIEIWLCLIVDWGILFVCGWCRWGIRYWNHKGQYCHWLVEGLRLCGAWGFIIRLWFMIFWLGEMKKLFRFVRGSSGIFCVIWGLLLSRLARLVFFVFFFLSIVVMFEVLEICGIECLWIMN